MPEGAGGSVVRGRKVYCREYFLFSYFCEGIFGVQDDANVKKNTQGKRQETTNKLQLVASDGVCCCSYPNRWCSPSPLSLSS